MTNSLFLIEEGVCHVYNIKLYKTLFKIMIKHFQLNNSEKSRNFAKTNDVQAKPNNESFSLEKHVRFVSAFK